MNLLELRKLSESKKVNEVNLDTSLNEIKDFIMNGMINVTQFHIYHLMTSNGTWHEALKVFYTTLQDEIDELAEATIAYYDIQSLDIEDNSYECELYLGFDFDKATEEVEELRAYCSNTIEMIDSVDNKSIVDKLIDIQEICDKLMYKLQLS